MLGHGFFESTNEFILPLFYILFNNIDLLLGPYHLLIKCVVGQKRILLL
jgi:hypothetical protein